MIATGGLLRMNRRQDSLRSKNRAENKRKRKAKKRKKNDVVVVKGKLNLCSPAGLVAAVGVVVLMVGISMAVLGYWPDMSQQEYQERRRTGVRANRLSYSKGSPASSNWTSKPLVGQTVALNLSHANSSAPEPSATSCGFFCDFLDNYLYSDNLKVFGPLVMGIGIFLFICANAVLHENRDKKTKIINLRDIYSTVIDLHSVRSKEYSPLNGLVNYTQSRSVEGPSGSHSGMPARSSWPSAGLGIQGDLGGDESSRRPSVASGRQSWSRDVQTFTDTVYSIYRDHSSSSEQTPQPKQWETTSIVTSSVNAFTLPVIKLNNCEVDESERAGGEGVPGDAIVGDAICEKSIEDVQAGSSHSAMVDTKETDGVQADALPALEGDDTGDASSSEQQQQEAAEAQAKAEWPQMQLFPPSPVARAMGSRLSLNALTDQPKSARRCSLSMSACRPGDRTRRLSCPRLERSNSKGYIKLTDLGGESFEAPDMDTSLVMSDREVAGAITDADAKADTDADADADAADVAVEELAAATVAQGEEDAAKPGTSAEAEADMLMSP